MAEDRFWAVHEHMNLLKQLKGGTEPTMDQLRRVDPNEWSHVEPVRTT